MKLALIGVGLIGGSFARALRAAGRVDRIVGEYHELRASLPAHVRVPGCDQFTVEVLAEGLQRSGFTVTWHRQATAKYGDLGLFFAHRIP